MAARFTTCVSIRSTDGIKFSNPAEGISVRLLCSLGPGVAQWLMHGATSRAVLGSNPGGVGHRDFSRGY